jgi:flavin reductase (DIM6/NTAB) family NADH-FMN oxidoreductase RutF
MFYDPRRNDHNLPHNPWNALVVPRPIGWISTLSKSGVVNLAPYSFFNTVSAHPPFVMFSSHPRKHSQVNAEETGEFVVNMATYELREVMNASSADFESEISEPERVGIEMVPCLNVKPPRVRLSPVALECKYNKTVRFTCSDGRPNPSAVIIGEVVGVHVADAAIVDGHVDVLRMKPIARLGYADYSVVDVLFSMARPAKPSGESRPVEPRQSEMTE